MLRRTHWGGRVRIQEIKVLGSGKGPPLWLKMLLLVRLEGVG